MLYSRAEQESLAQEHHQENLREILKMISSGGKKGLENGGSCHQRELFPRISYFQAIKQVQKEVKFYLVIDNQEFSQKLSFFITCRAMKHHVEHNFASYPHLL